MDTQKNQVIDSLKQATNVLVTVSANPSVDQLAGAIGLTLLLNKLGKHATAVFSGHIPDTIEFLQPEKTLEKTTDSLRDFIIALDKAKADKLRYKVEDQMVKIFITPYHTSITDKDLEFSQGDFNVQVVMALGVQEQKDLDTAITAHGRILHDATVIGVNNHSGTKLGSIDWIKTDASSLCEMLVDIGLAMKEDILDSQMATAFLTGIVAETNRFSNEKTSSLTMQMSAKLMTAGANQQLVATQLQPKIPEAPAKKPAVPSEEDAELPEVTEAVAPKGQTETPEESQKPIGSLEINHTEPKPLTPDTPKIIPDETEAEPDQITIDKEGEIKPANQLDANQEESSYTESSRLMTGPPTLGGGTLTANSKPENLDPSTDPLSAGSAHGTTLTHTTSHQGNPKPGPTLPPIGQSYSDTLADLERAVGSPHVTQAQAKSSQPAQDSDLNTARDAVSQAVSSTTPQILEPIYSLNARPMDINSDNDATNQPDTNTPANNTAPTVSNPTAPPPVPPPMMPPTFGPPEDDDQNNSNMTSGVAL